MMIFETITKKGQLLKGDVVLIKDYQDRMFPAVVKDIVIPENGAEEIILSKASNLYFVTDRYIEQESWVKRCCRIVNGCVFSLSNSPKSYEVKTR